MNLRTWSKQHTMGLLVGIGTTLIAIPFVMLILGALDDEPFSVMWHKFTYFNNHRSRTISLASIANLIWFHTYLRKDKYPFAMGVIMATVLNLLIIIYFKFLA